MAFGRSHSRAFAYLSYHLQAALFLGCYPRSWDTLLLRRVLFLIHFTSQLEQEGVRQAVIHL